MVLPNSPTWLLVLLGVVVAQGEENVCDLGPDVGACRMIQTRFYYDSSTNTCQIFNYGGCRGNGNNFATSEECLAACATNNTVTGRNARAETETRPESTSGAEKVETIPVSETTIAGSTEPTVGMAGDGSPPPDCLQEKITGRCRASIARYYYNASEGECQRFNYGGCGGNNNNFQDLESCQKMCGVSTDSPKPRSGNGQNSPNSNVGTVTMENPEATGSQLEDQSLDFESNSTDGWTIQNFAVVRAEDGDEAFEYGSNFINRSSIHGSAIAVVEFNKRGTIQKTISVAADSRLEIGFTLLIDDGDEDLAEFGLFLQPPSLLNRLRVLDARNITTLDGRWKRLQFGVNVRREIRDMVVTFEAFNGGGNGSLVALDNLHISFMQVLVHPARGVDYSVEEVTSTVLTTQREEEGSGAGTVLEEEGSGTGTTLEEEEGSGAETVVEEYYDEANNETVTEENNNEVENNGTMVDYEVGDGNETMIEGGESGNETMIEGGGSSNETMIEGGARGNETMIEGGASSNETLIEGGGSSNETMIEGGGSSNETMIEGGGSSNETMIEEGGSTNETIAEGGGYSNETISEGESSSENMLEEEEGEKSHESVAEGEEGAGDEAVSGDGGRNSTSVTGSGVTGSVGTGSSNEMFSLMLQHIGRNRTGLVVNQIHINTSSNITINFFQ